GSRCAAHAAARMQAGADSFSPARSRLFTLRQPGSDAVDGAVAIEQIVGVERDDLAALGDEMDAGAFDVADAEIEAVEKLHDGDAEDVLVAEIVGHLHGWQTA